MKLSFGVFIVALGSTISIQAVADNQSTKPTVGDLVVLSISYKADSIGLSCLPRTQAASVNADWVIECNRLAYHYLLTKTGEGLVFNRQINDKPFGMAADFIAKELMQNPSGFKAVNISQDFEFTHKKV